MRPQPLSRTSSRATSPGEWSSRRRSDEVANTHRKLTPPRRLEMTTISPIYTGVAAHIGKYADAVAVSGGGGTQIFVSGTPGLLEDGSVPEDFIDEARQCWANVEMALGKEVIRHQPAAMFSIIEGLVWPDIRVEVEVTAVLPE